MSPVLKFAAVFALGVFGFVFVPRHACHLSSPALFSVFVIISLVLVPLFAAWSKKPRVSWMLAFASPFITFGLMTFYVDVLHWEHFPKWLLRDGAPKTEIGCKVSE
jgi:hypothetical protein